MSLPRITIGLVSRITVQLVIPGGVASSYALAHRILGAALDAEHPADTNASRDLIAARIMPGSHSTCVAIRVVASGRGEDAKSDEDAARYVADQLRIAAVLVARDQLFRPTHRVELL